MAKHHLITAHLEGKEKWESEIGSQIWEAK
jgi:hypothetical protein